MRLCQRTPDEHGAEKLDGGVVQQPPAAVAVDARPRGALRITNERVLL